MLKEKLSLSEQQLLSPINRELKLKNNSLLNRYYLPIDILGASIFKMPEKNELLKRKFIATGQQDYLNRIKKLIANPNMPVTDVTEPEEKAVMQYFKPGSYLRLKSH